nr:replication initiation protein [Microvirus sp.]
MPCYHPLKAFVIGVKDGKRQLKVVSYDVDHLERSGDGYTGVSTPSYNRLGDKTEWLQIPCGQCVGCRLERSRQWANRCMLELQYHKSSYFVTLTYDEDHVPVSMYGDRETGEAHPSLTLRKRDFQLFMKRLRKKFGDGIRFFAAGEYGTETFRPHYHAIIFGLELDDLEVYNRSAQGFTYYNSPALQACWQNGFAVVAEVSWDTCAYTARYVMKKLTGAESQFYSDFNIEPEFSLMSRRPGIARQYYDDHPDLYQYDYINISTEDGGRKFRPPKYFDRLYDLDCPEDSARLKEIRKNLAIEAQKAKIGQSSLTYLEQLAVDEAAKLSQIKSLKRSLV